MHVLQPYGRLTAADMQQDALLFARVRIVRDNRPLWGKVIRISHAAAFGRLYHVVYTDGTEELLNEAQVWAIVDHTAGPEVIKAILPFAAEKRNSYIPKPLAAERRMSCGVPSGDLPSSGCLLSGGSAPATAHLPLPLEQPKMRTLHIRLVAVLVVLLLAANSSMVPTGPAGLEMLEQQAPRVEEQQEEQAFTIPAEPQATLTIPGAESPSSKLEEPAPMKPLLMPHVGDFPEKPAARSSTDAVEQGGWRKQEAVHNLPACQDVEEEWRAPDDTHDIQEELEEVESLNDCGTMVLLMFEDEMVLFVLLLILFFVVCLWPSSNQPAAADAELESVASLSSPRSSIPAAQVLSPPCDQRALQSHPPPQAGVAIANLHQPSPILEDSDMEVDTIPPPCSEPVDKSTPSPRTGTAAQSGTTEDMEVESAPHLCATGSPAEKSPSSSGTCKQEQRRETEDVNMEVDTIAPPCSPSLQADESMSSSRTCAAALPAQCDETQACVTPLPRLSSSRCGQQSVPSGDTSSARPADMPPCVQEAAVSPMTRMSASPQAGGQQQLATLSGNAPCSELPGVAETRPCCTQEAVDGHTDGQAARSPEARSSSMQSASWEAGTVLHPRKLSSTPPVEESLLHPCAQHHASQDDGTEIDMDEGGKADVTPVPLARSTPDGKLVSTRSQAGDMMPLQLPNTPVEKSLFTESALPGEVQDSGMQAAAQTPLQRLQRPSTPVGKLISTPFGPARLPDLQAGDIVRQPITPVDKVQSTPCHQLHAAQDSGMKANVTTPLQCLGNSPLVGKLVSTPFGSAQLPDVLDSSMKLPTAPPPSLSSRLSRAWTATPLAGTAEAQDSNMKENAIPTPSAPSSASAFVGKLMLTPISAQLPAAWDTATDATTSTTNKRVSDTVLQEPEYKVARLTNEAASEAPSGADSQEALVAQPAAVHILVQNEAKPEAHIVSAHTSRRFEYPVAFEAALRYGHARRR